MSPTTASASAAFAYDDHGQTTVAAHKWLSGGDFAYVRHHGGQRQTPGLNNVGLLARVWGKVTSTGLDFIFDDGSNRNDGSGRRREVVGTPGTG